MKKKKKGGLRIPLAMRIYEKVLLAGMLFLAESHMFLSIFRYLFVQDGNIYNADYRMVEVRSVWVLLIAAVVFALLSLYWPDARARVKEFFRRMLCKEMILAAALVAWIGISSAVLGLWSHPMNEWMFTDAAISLLVIFPLPVILGIKKGRKIIECLLHPVLLFGTVFVIFALWNVFHNNPIVAPSGNPIAMADRSKLWLGMHSNITAALTFTMLAVCVYMVSTQKWYLKIPYAIAIPFHVLAMQLTDCRSTLGAAVILTAGVTLMFTWTKTKGLHWTLRVILAVAAAAVAGFLMYKTRELAYRFFESTTHFTQNAQEAGQKLRPLRAVSTKLNGRQNVWPATWRAITKDFRNFMIGMSMARAHVAIEAELSSTIAHAHNSILQVAICAGVPAALAFVVFLAFSAVKCVKMGLNLNRDQFTGAYAVPVAVLAFMFINMWEPYLLFNFSLLGCVCFFFMGMAHAADDGRSLFRRRERAGVSQ